MKQEWQALIESLILDADDEGIDLTIATDNERSGWGYQTGDNSFMGGAYGFPHWAVVMLFPGADAAELADEVEDQLEELINS